MSAPEPARRLTVVEAHAPQPTQPVARAWLRKLVRAGIAASGAWLALAVLGAHLIGWDAFASPGGMAALALAACLPPAVLWLALAVIDREQELRHQVDALGRQLAALAWREPDARPRLESQAALLREEARVLTDAAGDAAARIDEGRGALAAQVQALSAVGDQIALRGGQTVAVLRRNVEALDRLAAALQTRLRSVEAQTGAQAELLDLAGEKAGARAREISETLLGATERLAEAGERGTLAAGAIRTELAGQGRALAGVAERMLLAADAMRRAREAFTASSVPLIERGEQAGVALGRIAAEFDRLGPALDGYATRLGATLSTQVGALDAAAETLRTHDRAAAEALGARAAELARLEAHAEALLRDFNLGIDAAGTLGTTLADRLTQAAAALEEKAGAAGRTLERALGEAKAVAGTLDAMGVRASAAHARTADHAHRVEMLCGQIDARLADLARRAGDLASSAAAASDRARSAETMAAAGADSSLATLRAGAQWVAESCTRSVSELREVLAAMRAAAERPAAFPAARAPDPGQARAERAAFLHTARAVIDGLAALGQDLRQALAHEPGEHALAAIRARAGADPALAAQMRAFRERFAALVARAQAADPDGALPLVLLASDLGRIHALLEAAG